MILLSTELHNQIKTLLYLVILICSHFMLRKLKGTRFEIIYEIWCMFWIILFATLMANKIKKDVKEWWNKD